MKKYIFTIFLMVFWCVWTLFEDPWELILVFGFAAVLCCFLFIKKRVVSLAAAAAVCIGVSIYNIDFLLRLTPALLLILAYRTALIPQTGKKQKTSSSDALYTALVFSGLISIGALIYDISFVLRNVVSFSLSRMYWIIAGIAVCFAVLIFFAFKNRYEKLISRLIHVYIFTGVCFVFASFGFLIDTLSRSLCLEYCPKEETNDSCCRSRISRRISY